jgi:coenzyme F420-reducing hydrogenase delta subunit
MPAKATRRKRKARAPAKKARPLRVIVFACSRTAERNIADDHMRFCTDDKVPVIPIMCSGRLSIAVLLKAFENGADGVLVAGCNPDECRFGFGARHGVATVIRTQRLLNLLGIEKERLRFSGGRDLTEAFSDFRKHLAKLGGLR